MSEAAFFYNTTTQRPDRTKPPSAHTNISPVSQAQPLKPIFKKSHHSGNHSKHSTRQRLSPSSTSTDSHSSHSARSTPQDLEQIDHDSMLSTPLPDYKHTANQSNKARAAARDAQASRKSSSTSGNSAERKHALQSAAAEARAAATARFETGRSSSLSSTTGSSGLTAVTSNEPLTDELLARPFSRRNGRRCLRDMSLPYPLPCDLAEIHRQILRTMLLCQVFNGPVCSPAFATKPPKRVLEVGCGTGFWSIMCHRHFSQRGFSSISFTGIDIAPLAPRMDSDDDMNWRFVQHDLRRVPLPFREDEFNLVMIKDMSLTTPMTVDTQQTYIDEYLRILKPGGTLEIWDGDHSLRMLLPHAPPSTKVDDEESEDEEQVRTNAMGTYTVTTQTPLAAPQNAFLNDYNTWISKAFEARKLNPMPCTSFRPMLLQEPDLTEIDSRRLAIPLGEVRWEREGVGGAVTQGTNGHAISSSKGKAREADRKTLTAGQAALRRTALMTVVQMIESLEPFLREASGKGQDEWDRWQGNMMNDLLKQNGTSWGECLEVGAWWARKKKPPSSS
ncbi:related to SAM binding motif containing protein [Phialocephala subalpina]|uniref:Related to SAM binding motif containing protein n=1 Tax=Phialocephala subalpina TaxID=576137 RepID=A0A1L7XV90_9HELO|nr:related to SAM binding motif containing protein [Phialocephala subalpina]